MQRYYQSGKLIDHYRILRLLGSGGASRVYLAQDIVNQQEVVLKFPLDDVIGGAAIFVRYLCEAEIGRLLDHPHIQRHLNQDEQRQEEYLVLEYLHGKTLREVMQTSTTKIFPPTKAIHLLLPICEALLYAHEHGVIHRDIKPENIFLLDNGEIKLIDFGIALLETRQQRRFRFQVVPTPVGTPAYMPPERLRGMPGDVRTDIYGIGVVLYELLCGRTPFAAQDGFSLVSEHISHDPVSILQWNPDLPLALATVVMRTIRHDPAKCYATMQDFLAELCHLDAVSPVDYVPDVPGFGERYRQVLLVGLMLFASGFLIIVFGLFAQLFHNGFH